MVEENATKKIMRYLRFSRHWKFKSWSSGAWRHNVMCSLYGVTTQKMTTWVIQYLF